MSREHPHDSADERGWPMRNRERTDAEHVGLVDQNSSMFYFPATSEMVRYEPADEELVEVSSYRVEAEETIADAVERVGDELGWDSLTEWAEEHVEPDENAERT